jgi:hypothetical protein
MSFITVAKQPAGVIPHGGHCAGGTPDWKACEACARREAAACIAFWQTMGGVPEIVRVHIKARMAFYVKAREQAGREAAEA